MKNIPFLVSVLLLVLSLTGCQYINQANPENIKAIFLGFETASSNVVIPSGTYVAVIQVSSSTPINNSYKIGIKTDNGIIWAKDIINPGNVGPNKTLATEVSIPESALQSELKDIRQKKMDETNQISKLKDEIDRINYNSMFNGDITNYDKAQADIKRIDQLNAEINDLYGKIQQSDGVLLEPHIKNNIVLQTLKAPIPKVVSNIHVGDNDIPNHGIAVNQITNRIYVAHGVYVSVIDGSNNGIVAIVQINGTTQDIAVNSNINRVYVANTQAVNNRNVYNMSVIDGSTNKVETNINLVNGTGPIAVNLSTNRIYACTGESVSIIDCSTNKIIDNINMGFCPWDIGVNPETNRIYVDSSPDNIVVVVDGNSNKVMSKITVGKKPTGIAMDPPNKRLYVANSQDNSISVIDSSKDTVISTIIVGSLPCGIAVDPSNKQIYVTNQADNNLSIVDGSNNSLVTSVKMGSHPLAIAINSSTKRIYVINWADNTVSVIQ